MKTVGINRIIIVGDLFPVPSNFSKYADGDILYLFGDKICDLFANSDYRILSAISSLVQ